MAVHIPHSICSKGFRMGTGLRSVRQLMCSMSASKHRKTDDLQSSVAVAVLCQILPNLSCYSFA